MPSQRLHPDATQAELMRSLLFVPADGGAKLDKALASGADAVIVDLEDSVAPERKAGAREAALEFLQRARAMARRPRLLVRINALQTGLADADLDAVVPGQPVESAAGLFLAGTFRDCSRRLIGLTWGPEDLAAELGAEANRESDGTLTEPYRIARAMCLFGAAAAGVPALETIHVDFRNLDALRRDTEIARRDGFAGRLAIHPAQVPIINDVFTPTAAEIAQAKAIVAAFAAQPNAGTVGIDGKMYDRPHLLRAQRLLANVKA